MVASLTNVRRTLRGAYELLTEYDKHYEDCDCSFCVAVSEIGYALMELKDLSQAFLPRKDTAA